MPLNPILFGDLGEAAFRDYETMKGKRGNNESEWREIAQRIVPNDWRLFQSQGIVQTKGEARMEFVIDSTGILALGRFASIVDSLLTPRNQTWHRVKADVPELNKIREVNLWFGEVNRLLFKYRYAPMANFTSQNQQNFSSLGAYGSGAVFIDPLDSAPGLRYKSVHLSEIFFRENHQGIIDTAYRYFALTARQAVQKWGENRVPKAVLDATTIDPDREFFFLHCVQPREEVDSSRKDFRGMAFTSLYVSETDKMIVEEGGFRNFPYAISRYTQTTGEVYGRGPGNDILPSLRTLNEMKKAFLKQGHRAVDPVLLVHDDGVLDSFSLRPGATNFGGVNAEGRPLVHTLPTGNIATGKDMLDEERDLINDTFLVSLFRLLVDSPVVSATEVLERAKEKGILLAPTVGRQQSEYLGPLITREISVLQQQNLLPPLPPVLVEAGGEFNIEYDSPLSRAQRSEEASGVMRTLESAIQIAGATGKPDVLDHFNFDVIIPDVASIQAVPAKWMNGLVEIQAIRDGRAQQEQQQQLLQAAPGAAALIKADAVSRKVG